MTAVSRRGSPVPTSAVTLHAHRVADRVQRVGADHQREQVEAVLLGVPAAVVDAAELLEQVDQVDPATSTHAVLAVGREDVVLRRQGTRRPDLRRLLPQRGVNRPSSPCRCSAVASVSKRRISTMSA